MSNNRIPKVKRTEKKPLPEGTTKTESIQVTVQNVEVLKIQLLAQIDKKLQVLIDRGSRLG